MLTDPCYLLKRDKPKSKSISIPHIAFWFLLGAALTRFRAARASALRNFRNGKEKGNCLIFINCFTELTGLWGLK